MVAYTTTYNLAKPTVGDDEDAWGGYLNGNFDTLESLLKGTTALTSLNLSGNITFGDGDRAVFGADSDLQIWFDGTHSRIEDSATNAGDLYIRGSNNLRLQTWDGVSSWQNAIVLDDAGAAELYHDGALKLTSTSTGIDVTGTVTADGLTVNSGGDQEVYFGDATDGIALANTGAVSSVEFGNSQGTAAVGKFTYDRATGKLVYAEGANGSEDDHFAIDGTGQVGIQTISPRAPLHVAPTGAASDNFNVLVSQFRPNIVLEDLSTSATDFQLFVDGNELQFRYGDASTDTKLANSSMSIQNDGTVIIDAANDEDLILRGTSPFVRFQEGTTAKAYIQWSNAGFLYLRNQEDGSGVRIRDDIEFTPDGSNWYDIWHANNDGSGSGLDADLLDGRNSWSNGNNFDVVPYVDTAGVMEIGRYIDFHQTDGETGDYTVRLDASSSGLSVSSKLSITDELTISDPSPQIRFSDSDHDDFWIHVNSNKFYVLVDRDENGAWETPYPLELDASTNVGNMFGNQVWTAGNDGSGSGLDADTVDGLQATSFLRSDAADSWSGTLTGTGAITTSAPYIEAGNGSGSMAMTINDGGGNANLTFNHRSRTPDVNGQAGRIQVNVDATTGEGAMTFQASSAPVTAGTAVNLTTGLVVAHDYIEVPYIIRHQGDTDTQIQFTTNTITLSPGGSSEFFVNTSGAYLTDSALHEDYDALSGTTPTIDVNAGGAFSLTMTGNTTFTFGATTTNYGTGFVLQLTGNGGTVTWPTSVDWAGGTAPDAPASGETDIYVFWTRNGGTTWYGVQSIDAAA